MSARFGPFKSRRRSVCGFTGLLVVLLLFPATAAAAPPTCAAGDFSGLHDQVIPFSAAPCSGGNGTLTLSVVTPPAHGQVGFAAGGVPQYTPDAGFVGPDSFTYKATDQTPRIRTSRR